MRGVILSAACVGAALSVHAADIGGYFHEQQKRESRTQCPAWIAQARAGAPADLQYRVGLCYWNGWGVPEDRVAAEAWLRRAAERGHHEAQTILGRLRALKPEEK